VKGLYNEKFPLDHVDDEGCEMGHDADGLVWVRHSGQGVRTRSIELAQLEDVLEEVKGLYNQKYPHDHVDDAGHEVGCDTDGLLWVRYTNRSQEDELQDLLNEVKGLYNEQYPLDHVDDVDREVGCDSDGLVWTKYTGQGIDRSQAERLEGLLEEVKCLYNERYPEDTVDDVDCEFGYDADGMLWEKFIGQGLEHDRIGMLEGLLAEVKDLYNEKYPQDHVDDLELDIGVDVEGLSWVEYTGPGPKTWAAKVEKLDDLLEEVKDLYNEKHPQDHVDDEEREIGSDADGLLWVRYTAHTAEKQEQKVDKLEDLLREVRALYNERYPQDHVDDAERDIGTDADGLLWVRYTGHSTENRDRMMSELQDLLGEVKGLYCEKYPLDHIDEMCHEIGIDADGLLWVAYTGKGTEKRERKLEDLEGLLEEVRCLYNEKYPLDHIDDESAEVGRDSEGLLWVRYTGSGGRLAHRVQRLEDLLDEVKCLYSEMFPLDYLDDEHHELGYDTDGLLWVQHSGPGIDDVPGLETDNENESVRSTVGMEKLQDMLHEVRSLYNDKYPLDHVDDVNCEAGYDTDGLLWVKYTGLSRMAALEMSA